MDMANNPYREFRRSESCRRVCRGVLLHKGNACRPTTLTMHARSVVAFIGLHLTWFGRNYVGGLLRTIPASLAQDTEDGLDSVADQVVCPMAESAGGKVLVSARFPVPS
jgi:hypothetical protein